MAKYELTATSKVVNSHTVYRIRALSTFDNPICGTVTIGDLGGWVESEDNLYQTGTCWVLGESAVYGSAQVYGDACVEDNAEVYDSAMVYDNAWISGYGKVYGSAQAYGNSKVRLYAEVYGNSQIYEFAEIYDYAKVYDDAQLYGNSEVFENAEIYDTGLVDVNGKVYGNAKVYKFGYVTGDATVYGDAQITGMVTIQDTASVYGFATIGGASTISSNAIVRACSIVIDQNVGTDEIIETLCDYSVSPSVSPSHSASPSPECQEDPDRTFWVNGSGTIAGDGSELSPFTYRQLMNYFNPDLGDECGIVPENCDLFKIYNNISFVASGALFSVKRNLDGRVILKSPTALAYPWTIDTIGNPNTTLSFFKYETGYSIRNIEVREFLYCQNNDGDVLTKMTDITTDYRTEILFKNVGIFAKKDLNISTNPNVTAKYIGHTFNVNNLFL
jgi:UDP-3-O-[3-hydroxymyristoyl] glucosamine N-acyltransferase